MQVKQRILSGVQPSGKLHLGNYFGAIRQHIERQGTGECFYFIADYHALTTLPDAELREAALAAKQKGRLPRTAKQILADNVTGVALDYLALGLDPTRTALFRQSDVPEVCELAWVLSTVCPVSTLELAHSYKDKVAKGVGANAGLLTYPLLMAADILAYRSNLVPVGKDQKQHLEITRDLAGAFNRQYRTLFPLPEPVFTATPVVPGTDGQKMSKSYGNTIDLFADREGIKKAVSAIVTDPTPLGEPLNPDSCNVFALMKLFLTPDAQDRMAEQYRNPTLNAQDRGGKPFGYGAAKGVLVDLIDGYFANARGRREQLVSDPGLVEEVLRVGGEKARAVARITLDLVRKAVGLS